MSRVKITKTSTIAMAFVGLTLVGVSGAAVAQSLFIRDRNVSVLERPRPGYEPEGIRAGQFIVRPKVDIGAGYDSNVFALSDIDTNEFDDFVNEQDTFFFIRPSVRMESDWTRHGLAFGGHVSATRFSQFDSEGTFDGGAYVDGHFDVARRASLFGGLSYDRLNESRRNFNSSFLFEEPVGYDLLRGYAGFEQEINRIRYEGRIDIADFDYDDVDLALPQGTGGLVLPIDQDFRDRTSTDVTGEIGFAVSPSTALYLKGVYNWQDFETADTLSLSERDSEGYRVTGGVEFDLTKLVRGRLDVGYFSQEFDDARFNEIDGVAIDAALEWFPTDLTTVTLTGSRGVSQSSIVSAGAHISTEATLRVDHELKRNIILSAFVAAGEDEYDDPLLDSVGDPLLDSNGNELQQNVDKIGAGFGAKYLVNRNVTAGVDYTFENQDVEFDVFNGGFDADFDIHQVIFTVTVQR